MDASSCFIRPRYNGTPLLLMGKVISYNNKFLPNNNCQNPVFHTDSGMGVIFDVTVWLQIAHYTHP